jgi:hypothetical protein
MAWALSWTVIFNSICAKSIVISKSIELYCSTKLLSTYYMFFLGKCNTNSLCVSILNLLNMSFH